MSPSSIFFLRCVQLTYTYTVIVLVLLMSSQRIAGHGPRVAVYAAKHGYPTLLDATAPHALRIPLGEMADLLPPNLLALWVSADTNIYHNA